MPDWKPGTALTPTQRPNPVIHYEILDADALGLPVIDPAQLDAMFSKSSKIKTWNRAKTEAGTKELVNDPHWICTKRGIGLHTDPGFPRYTYQLKLLVDPGTFTVGADPEVAYPLMRGVFYVLDTHSPHSVVVREKGSTWNLSASIDSPSLLDKDETRARLIEYAKTAKVTDGFE